MAKGTRIRNVQGGRGPLSTAWLTLRETFRDPFSTTMIWSEIPIETKSYDPAEDARRRQLRDISLGRVPARVPPLFKLVIFVVVALTAAAGAAHIVMALIWMEPTEMQRSAFETMETSWKIGFGALVGLLGGKAIR